MEDGSVKNVQAAVDDYERMKKLRKEVDESIARMEVNFQGKFSERVVKAWIHVTKVDISKKGSGSTT